MASSGALGGGAAPRALHSARAVDVASASNFQDFEVLHLHLDLRVEFSSRTLSGTATLDLRCLVPAGAAELRLDSHPCLEVTAVALRRGPPSPGQPPGPDEPVSFHTQPFARYGCALCLCFPQPRPAGERFQVLLTYGVREGPAVSAQMSPRCPRRRERSRSPSPVPQGLEPQCTARPSPPGDCSDLARLFLILSSSQDAACLVSISARGGNLVLRGFVHNLNFLSVVGFNVPGRWGPSPVDFCFMVAGELAPRPTGAFVPCVLPATVHDNSEPRW